MFKYYCELFKFAFTKAWAICLEILGVMTILIGLIVLFLPKCGVTLSNLVWMIPLFIFCILFAIRIIIAPYEKNKELEKKIVDLENINNVKKAEETKPTNIGLLMTGLNIFHIDNSNLSGILIDTKIWNTGTPCAIIEWILRITPKEQSTQKAHYRNIPETFTLSGNPTITIHSSESLEYKISTNEINNTPIEGKLYFCTKLTLETVTNPSTIFNLSVKDITGNYYHQSKSIKDF